MSKIQVDEIVNKSGDGDSGLDLSTNDVVAVKTANTERMRVDASGKVGIGTTSPDDFLEVKGSTNTTTRQVKIVDSSDATATHIGQFNNISYFTNNTFYNGAWTRDDGAVGTSFLGLGDGVIQFGTDTGATPSERMRVDSSGNVLIGKTATGTSAGVQLEPTGTANIARSGDLCLVLDRLTNTGEICSIRTSNVAKGGITVNSGSVSFNTSSDYRLKENVVTDWDATTRLKQLKPSRFNFKEEKDTTLDGFIAHEVSSIVPEAITGEKDAVDKEGNPIHQGIDQSKLVPLLTKAVQELTAKVETLEAKVTALESK